MPDQKISQLTAIVTVDNSTDVLPIVDISANTTKKVTPTQLKTSLALDNVDNTSDANKPVSIAQQDALNAKVSSNAAITAGTAPKITFDAKGLVTSGDLLDETDIPTGINANKIGTGVVSTTEFEYLNGVTSAIQTQLNAKQATLVSGTNIKTLNSISLLGSGDISLPGSAPSGVAGAIQFTDGSVFASDATKFFWDNTNKRLGIGTNAPSTTVDILPPTQTATLTQFDCLRVGYSNSTIGVTNGSAFQVQVATTGTARYSTTLRLSGSSDTSQAYLKGFDSNLFGVMLNRAQSNLGLFSDNGIKLGDTAFAGSEGSASAQVHIKGSGSTSATTSLLVQNSSGSSALQVTDDRIVKTFNGLDLSGNILYANGVGNASIFGGTSWLFDTAATGTFRFRNGSMALGASVADATAHLDVQSTTKGFLPPRMTTTQKNAIATPAAGLVVYDSTTNKLCCYNGSTWNDLF